jgi:hypothetical protein
LDAIETAIGASPKLRFYSGAMPANCAAARTGTLIAEVTPPADWMANAVSGSKALSGTWQDLSADNAGTIGHYALMDNAGTTCHVQGTVTATGGGGDVTVDNTVVAAAQQITVTAFTLTDNNS